MIWIYDIEIYINYFSVIFKNPKTKELKEFIIFNGKNDLDDLYFFINDPTKWLVGYNSYNFDNQLLNYIYKFYFDLTMSDTSKINEALFSLTKMIIDSDFNDYRYNLPFNSLDLMKIGFYRKSLKLIGVSLRWPKLQDLPIPIDEYITVDQINIIRKYNLNDVLITEQLFYHLEDNIKLRFELAKKYNVDVYSESDSGVANRLLEKFYSEASGLKLGAFRGLRTERKYIPFDWVILDSISFHTTTLDTALEEIKNHTYYEAQPFFSKSITFDGIKYKLGLGGLHSEDTGDIFEESKDVAIIDADIGSMYPATMINHQLTPAHLGSKFLKNYTNVRDDRIVAKHSGDVITSEGLKIVLNSTVGKTLNKYHWLYDPLVNLKVTINGQLFLLMLIERLALKGFHTISANTDGVTVYVPRIKEQEYFDICKRWEQDTKYNLEYTRYTKYIRRDVNNYIAIQTDGKVKTKGIFIKDFPTQFSNMTDPLNKGWDKPIVSIALYEYFVNSIPIVDTIRSHKDIYDFCIAKKIDSKFDNETYSIEKGVLHIEKLQKSVRYYVSTNGKTLLKVNKETKAVFNYEANQRVTIFNNYVEKNIDEYNVNYAYYINATQKIIDIIINPQLSLF